MREGYQQLPDLEPQHNEVHRKAYQTPYLLRRVSTYPGSDDMKELEVLVCMNSTVSALCTKINSSVILSAKLS